MNYGLLLFGLFKKSVQCYSDIIFKKTIQAWHVEIWDHGVSGEEGPVWSSNRNTKTHTSSTAVPTDELPWEQCTKSVDNVYNLQMNYRWAAERTMSKVYEQWCLQFPELYPCRRFSPCHVNLKWVLLVTTFYRYGRKPRHPKHTS